MSTAQQATSIVAGSLSGVAAEKIFPYVSSLEPSVILGAFMGATIYALSSKPIGKKKQIIFFLFSFVMGVSSLSKVAADVLSEVAGIFLPNLNVQFDTWIGALVASACAIHILLWLMNRAKNVDSKGDSA